MKPLLAIFLLLCLPDAWAQELRIFTNYDEFYTSLPGRLFTGDGEEIAVSRQHGVRIDAKHYRFRHARAFPGESVYPEDLGRTATLYRSPRYYCVHGIGATSGTGSRHVSVYLIDKKSGRSYKLASLFGSCLGIGLHAGGGISFLKADIINYRAAYDADGVVFSEHILSGDAFFDGAVRREVRFVEPGNFYRFRFVN